MALPAGRAESPFSSFVVAEKFAYSVLPPEAVVPFGATYMEWSPTGRYLMVFQSRPRAKTSHFVDAIAGRETPSSAAWVTVWDRLTGRTQDYGLVDAMFPGGFELSPQGVFNWIPGSDVGLLPSSETEWIEPKTPQESAAPHVLQLYKLDLAAGSLNRFRIVGKAAGAASNLAVEISPTGSLFVVQNRVSAPRALESHAWTISKSNAASPAVQLEEGHWSFRQWCGNGEIAELTGWHRQTGAPPVRKTLYFDLRQNSIVTFVRPPDPYRPPAGPEIAVRRTPGRTEAGTARADHGVWWLASAIPSEYPVTLLSADAQAAALAPSADAVAILDRGVVTVRAIAKITKAAWEQGYRQWVIQNAKQAALAFLMYAADYDDLLPSLDTFQGGAVEPYTKDTAVLRGFNFRLGGANMNNLQNPAGTILGFVPGPGGFAVAYADGHVRWQTDKP
jgi:prepilin-type processing-associated H-X9-DG protein